MNIAAIVLLSSLLGAPPVSTDQAGGQSTTAIDPPAVAGAMAPNLLEVDGRVLLSWFEPADPAAPRPNRRRPRRLRLRLAAFADGAWSEPRTIVERDDFFANWADVPTLGAASDGTLFAHWPQRSGPDTFAYDVMLARSDDDGVTWRVLGTAHDDGTQTEHGFVSFVPESDGVRAFWLDGREMAGGHGEGGEMTIRTGLMNDSIGAATVLDPRVCECCNTSAAVTDHGPVIVYRDRSDDEVRDIFIARRVGDTWTEPAAVHDDGWLIAGCPVNGPSIAAQGNQVVVGWFTGSVEQGVVRIAFSSDAGATFSTAFLVDDSWPMGRVSILMLEEGDAIICWLDDNEGDGAVTLRRISPAGDMGSLVRVGGASLSRSAGFPRIARTSDGILVVWTGEDDEGPTRLRAETIPLQSLTSAEQPANDR